MDFYPSSRISPFLSASRTSSERNKGCPVLLTTVPQNIPPGVHFTQDTNEDQEGAFRVSLERRKKTAESNSLPIQGNLRQLLRTFVVFCRFGIINSGLLWAYYTPKLSFCLGGTEAILSFKDVSSLLRVCELSSTIVIVRLEGGICLLYTPVQEVKPRLLRILNRSQFWSRAGSHAREPAALRLRSGQTWEPPLLGIRDLPSLV